MSEPVLRLTGIRHGYGVGERRLDVLTGADLVIRPGEMVALTAPSGAGKSTLLHVAGLLESPGAGEVVVDGRIATALDDAGRTALRRDAIGFIYQFHHLLPEFSALENVEIPQLIRGYAKSEARRRATELLASLGLEGRLQHRPSELSGGEQQRVAIARALANAPALLLADEPTGNLDPRTSDHVFDGLARIVREAGVGALVATHNLELAARMDRRVTLDEGRVVDLDVRG